MALTRIALACFVLCAALAGCRDFPEVDLSDQSFDANTRYPEFVPLEVLLEQPVAQIDAGTEAALAQRAADFETRRTALSPDDPMSDDLLDRIDALRQRLQGNITAPTVLD